MFLASRTPEAAPLARAEMPAERLGDAAFVLSLRAHGVFALDVLRAMETVRRDHFAPRRFADLAQADVALPLAFGQTMTAPSTVAAMMVALDVRPGHRVLEVGTGSGYTAALLARLGAEVFTRERHPVVASSARSRLESAGFASFVDLACRDGLVPDKDDARFDRILLNGSVPDVGAGLFGRLAAGGRIVAAQPVDGRNRLAVFSRDGDGQVARTIGAAVRIAPLRHDGVKHDRPGSTES